MNFKDLIKWISGSGEKKQEVPAKPASNRRRHSRLECPEGKVFFADKGPYELLDLSFGGLRFTKKTADRNLDKSFPVIKPDEKFAASVVLGSVKLNVTLVLKNQTTDFAGCSFVDLSANHSKILSNFLKPRILAKSLHEISAGALKTDESAMKMRWFQGDENTQVFIWENDAGKPIKVEFYFLDYLIKMDEEKKLVQTGKIREGMPKTGFGRGDASAFAFFNTPSQKTLKIGQTIMEASVIPEPARGKIIENMEREERRLFQRYFPENDEKMIFSCDNPGNNKLLVTNLSLEGIAFLNDENLSKTFSPEKGEFSGVLRIGSESIEAKVQILYQNKQIMGGYLKLREGNSSERLAAYLAPRILAQSLEETQPPVEEYPFAPPGSRPYLYVGRHNTHILSLIAPVDRLVTGRIAYKDIILCFEKGKTVIYRSERGIVFPGEWEIPIETLERLDTFPEEARFTCTEILKTAKISEDVSKTWLKVLELV
ncbi:MAG: PilZ domain-containing protein [Candidatus Riflebacteria bacterium]|nr:PilZ domain-containing protein [Candidatus Riflebacteria bacterium]